ncbi:jg18385 [Pararge aegeria aegeria]|uniref:Jg18385 protein n=1 Tax=Pararge aegeria aegeria TaxID=348720 RepID=A0A8S4R2U9_9NEOP|nr:jg18385 [Pararge aegeria aegeria]
MTAKVFRNLPVVFVSLLTVIGGSQDSNRVKRLRADSAAVQEPAQALDAPEPEPNTAPAPIAFIHPSVKEYLELGMAIPGKNSSSFKNSHSQIYFPVYTDLKSVID